MAKESLQLQLKNPNGKLTEYQKNIFIALSEMSLDDQKTVAINALSDRVKYNEEDQKVLTSSLIHRLTYNKLTLEELVKLEAYIKTYFGRFNLDGAQYVDLSDKSNFESKLSVDGPLAFISVTYSEPRTAKYGKTLLFQLAVPNQLLKQNPNVVVAAFLVISNYVEVLLTGEL